MPKKINDLSSYGQKLISLFARLLFSREKYSLTELAQFLSCSKQSVLRLIEDIQRSYKVEIEELREGNRKYVRMKKPDSHKIPASLTGRELAILQMCRAFAQHLLGAQQFEEAATALYKSQTLLPQPQPSLSGHFGAIQFGTIDYSSHCETIQKLIQAMNSRKVCEISYQAIMEELPKTLYIKPLKIFSHIDTVYLHARLAKAPGKPYAEPEFDPLLAIHRIKNVELTERSFEFPADYNFEKFFNRHFGVIKEEAFEVEVEFSGWSAKYVVERVWSPDQKIESLEDDRIKLIFTASSEPEVVSWLLSYGDDAVLRKPYWLAKNVSKIIKRMGKAYKNG
jgi:predicted DNA-binding transcriptional regulator YafY